MKKKSQEKLFQYKARVVEACLVSGADTRGRRGRRGTHLTQPTVSGYPETGEAHLAHEGPLRSWEKNSSGGENQVGILGNLLGRRVKGKAGRVS